MVWSRNSLSSSSLITAQTPSPNSVPLGTTTAARPPRSAPTPATRSLRIPANLLFFERGGPTDTIWYYELPLPAGRKKYSKTAPLQFEEFAPALAWWQQREEGPQAWKVDFAAKLGAARAAAAPHWQRAEAERTAALALGKPIREAEQEIASLGSAPGNGRKAELQERLRDLKARQQAHEATAKSAQAEGDALYWPIYNLDLKNPNAKAGLEHADPKDLIASMRGHEAEVMRLLAEIEALVNEVER